MASHFNVEQDCSNRSYFSSWSVKDANPNGCRCGRVMQKFDKG